MQMPPVAAKGLVTAITGKGDTDALTGKTRHVITGQNRVVSEWLTEMTNQFGQQVDGIRPTNFLVVLGPQMLCHLARIGQFVQAFIVKTNGVGLDRPRTQPRHGGNRNARIDTAGEKGPEWHIRDQTDSGGLKHQLAQSFGGIGERRGTVLCRVDIPIAEDLFHPPVANHHRMRWRQFANGGKTGAGRRNVLICQILIDGGVVGLPRQVWSQLEEAADFRCKDHAVGRLGIDQGLDPHAVADDNQLLLLAVPDGEGEHAAQLGQTGFQTITLEQAEQHLGIGMPEKLFSLSLQFAAQIRKIIDFTVKDDDVAPIRAEHRLMPRRRQINDGQPDKPEACGALTPLPCIIRAAVCESSDGTLQIVTTGPRISTQITKNATHACLSSVRNDTAGQRCKRQITNQAGRTGSHPVACFRHAAQGRRMLDDMTGRIL